MVKGKKERVLITGATGFVGANLVRRLVADKKDVHVLLRKGSDVWRIRDVLKDVTRHIADLTDARSIKNAVLKANSQYIFHLAAEGLFFKQQNAAEMVAANIQGTVHLLEAARELSHLQMIINVGSFAEYGNSIDIHSITENTLLEPANAYGVSKASQSLFALYFARLHNLPITVVRPSLIYGPYEEERRLVPAAILAHLRGKELILGSPEPQKDFIYIDDVLDALCIITTTPDAIGNVFNIASGRTHSVKDVVRTVKSVWGVGVPLQWRALPNRPWDNERATPINTAKAKKILGWKARYSLTDGIEKTIEWFEENRKRYE